MKNLEKIYDPKIVEERLYKKWMDKGYFHAEVDKSKKPFTVMMPPPNITGQIGRASCRERVYGQV